MVTTGLSLTDVTVKGRHAGRGAWVMRVHSPPGSARLYAPQELPSTRGTWLFVLCDSDQQGLLPGATLKHRRQRVGG